MTSPKRPAPGSKRARHMRWRRISTWVTLVALLGFTVATIAFFGSLNRDKNAEATRDLLARIAAALEEQAERVGTLPATLGDLQPTVASGEIVREDAYGTLIQFLRVDDKTFHLRSLGKDGVAGTADDILWPAESAWPDG